MVDLHVSCTIMTAVHLEVTTSEGALDITGLHRSLYYSSLPSLYLSGVMWNNKLKSTVRKLVSEIAWGSGTGGTDKKKNAGVYLRTRKFRNVQCYFFQWQQPELRNAEFACKSRQCFWDRTGVCKSEQLLKMLLSYSIRTSGFKAKNLNPLLSLSPGYLGFVLSSDYIG